MYVHKTPKLLQLLYPGLTWHRSRKEKKVYLTFDDGPVPNATDFVLDTMKSMGVKGNFFCVGDNVRKHRATYEKLQESGHRIANHTFNHLNGWQTGDEEYYENIHACEKLLGRDNHPPLFRPPYGKIKRNQAKEVLKTHEVIMWDVLSGDFDPALEDDVCLKRSIDATKNGSIIIFHDSNKTYNKLKYVLPRYIEKILSRGMTFELL